MSNLRVILLSQRAGWTPALRLTGPNRGLPLVNSLPVAEGVGEEKRALSLTANTDTLRHLT
ncbi:hypothetical protein LBMAG56_16480 [Verrucomicrobiota bacterium]|nr:hypothetical protein LBMAG56_16480 [Verrucomicrobiota bacterium]